MTNKTKPVIRLYFVPQTFPCGPQSSCCGPVGQSEEELRHETLELRKNFPEVEVQTVNVSGRLNMGRDLHIIKLLNTFGLAACPIFTVDGEVVSMGPPIISEVISLLRDKLNKGEGQRP